MKTEKRCGTILAVCISKEKGTVKRPIETGEMIEDYGLKGDAHAGSGHRQISLLSAESVKAFNEATGAMAEDGDFGENLLVLGLDLKNLPIGTILKTDTVRLQITQIGKECHEGCTIRKRTGDCIMPREGVFAKVLRGGTVEPGDFLYIEIND